MKKEKDNLFEAFGMFWEAAEEVRRAVKYGQDDEVLNFASDLSKAMDYYEHVQDEHYSESLKNEKNSSQ